MRKLYMPQEIEVWYLLPAIRREMVRMLVQKGLSQKEAADKMGITPSAVSQYMKSKRASGVELGAEAVGEIEQSVQRVMDGQCLVKEVTRLCEDCKKHLVLCRLHKKYGHVSVNCTACMGKMEVS